MKLLILLSIILISPQTVPAQQNNEDRGSICIAPFPVISGDAALGRNITKETTFTFSIDSKQNVDVKQGESKTISDLSLTKKHSVRVLIDGKPHESFSVTFSKLQTKKVCMWLYFPHTTWQVYPYVEGKHGCSCFA